MRLFVAWVATDPRDRLVFGNHVFDVDREPSDMEDVAALADRAAADVQGRLRVLLGGDGRPTVLSWQVMSWEKPRVAAPCDVDGNYQRYLDAVTRQKQLEANLDTLKTWLCHEPECREHDRRSVGSSRCTCGLHAALERSRA